MRTTFVLLTRLVRLQYGRTIGCPLFSHDSPNSNSRLRSCAMARQMNNQTFKCSIIVAFDSRECLVLSELSDLPALWHNTQFIIHNKRTFTRAQLNSAPFYRTILLSSLLLQWLEASGTLQWVNWRVPGWRQRSNGDHSLLHNTEVWVWWSLPYYQVANWWRPTIYYTTRIYLHCAVAWVFATRDCCTLPLCLRRLI